MHKSFFILLSFLLTTDRISAQMNQPYGDTVRAVLASHHIDQPTGDPIMRLGYIDVNNATRQELLDNLAVGLRVAGGKGYQVHSYKMTVVPVGGDVRASARIKGGKIPGEVFNQLRLNTIKKGDRIILDDIRVEDTYGTIRAMNTIGITVR